RTASPRNEEMTKLRLLILILAVLLSPIGLLAQNTSYTLYVHCVDKDSAFPTSIGIPPVFPSKMGCIQYINQLPGILRSKGYVTASLDSILYDSAFAEVILFAGDIYKWAQIDASHIDPAILQETGWRERMFTYRPMDFPQVQLCQNRILNY